MWRSKAFFLIVFSLTSAWGGVPDSQPATIHGARLVPELQAIRKGDRVTLSWRQPREIAEPQSSVHHSLIARVCRDIASIEKPRPANFASRCAQPLAKIDPNRPEGVGALKVSSFTGSEVTLRYVDTLPEADETSDPRRFAFYTVELLDNRGHRAGLSSAAAVSLAPSLPAKGLHTELDARGVYLIWENEVENPSSSLQFDYRVYRQEKGHSKRLEIPYLKAIVHTPEGERWSAIDTGVKWDETYVYWITPVTRVYSERGLLLAQVRGEDSQPLEVTTHDVFPPAVPERLLAVPGHSAGRKFIDLTWSPSLEKDLAGYNVYRREEGAAMVRLNATPITMLSFQDKSVVSGRRYFYCISAVDLRGNESAKSPELTEAAP